MRSSTRSGESYLQSAVVLTFQLFLATALPCQLRADPYGEFSTFAETAFGAEREPLTYSHFGGILDLPRDWWEFVSETSATIGFVSNLPARSHVEYGPDDSYQFKTEVTDRHYAVHLHQLAGLKPGVTYRYRVVMVDERGTVVRSEPRSITPTQRVDAIRIPSQAVGPPFMLDTPDAYYLLEEDIDAPDTAFDLRADGVTLDLGGHRVTYNGRGRSLTGNWPQYVDRAAFGVRSLGSTGFRILNGSILQGAGQSGAHASTSIGFNPMYLREGSYFEVAGVRCEYSGAQMVGLFAHYPGGVNVVHHNVFVDRGLTITDRHGTGSKSMAITGDVNTFHTHHNLVKRTRQSGLDGARINDNEIYIDSYATNSFGIPGLRHNREGFRNRIFGTGYHVVGIGWGNNNWWHDNFIHLVGQGPDSRFPEYGDQESLNGIRLTQYAGASAEYSNSIVERNLIIITGGACSATGDCTQARGLQYFSDPDVVDNVVRNNTIKVVMNDEISVAAALVTQGLIERCGTESPMLYEGNTLISNITNVRLGDSYGAGCNHVFVDNELVRVGTRSDYETFRFAYPVAVIDQFFFDTTFTGGAGPESVKFTNSEQELTVGWTLTMNVRDSHGAVSAADVTVLDVEENRIAALSTDSTGQASFRVVAYTESAPGRVYSTPTHVTVESHGSTTSQWIDMDSTRVVDIVLEPGVNGGGVTSSLKLLSSPSTSGRGVDFRWSRNLGGVGVLSVSDLSGSRLWTTELPAGSLRASWDGRDDEGALVNEGTYVARLIGPAGGGVCPAVVRQ